MDVGQKILCEWKSIVLGNGAQSHSFDEKWGCLYKKLFYIFKIP